MLNKNRSRIWEIWGVEIKVWAWIQRGQWERMKNLMWLVLELWFDWLWEHSARRRWCRKGGFRVSVRHPGRHTQWAVSDPSLGLRSEVQAEDADLVVRETPQSPLSAFTTEAGHSKRAPAGNQEDGSHQHVTMLVPWSWTFSPQHCKKLLFFYKLPSLWYFIIATQLD